MGRGELADAAGQFERSTELQPQAFWPTFYQGVCAYRRGRFEAAERCFHVCVALHPGRAECHYNRGRAREAQGRRGPARRDYERALELDPALAPAALNRALLLYREGRYAAALDGVRRALKHEPGNGEARKLEARLRAAQGAGRGRRKGK